jgi:hypothetical protein
MPLSKKIYSFPENNNETFKGLPGMIADSLPDDFGNAVMNAWIASQGKSTTDITPLQRLQYIGNRDNFIREDFYSLKKISPIFTKQKIDHIIEEITEHVSEWNDLANDWSTHWIVTKKAESYFNILKIG